MLLGSSQSYAQDSLVLNDTITLEPRILTLESVIYYCFDTEQAEFIYNGMIQREYYYDHYYLLKNDYQNIIILYDKKIDNLDNIILAKDKIIIATDNKVDEKNNEISDIKIEFKKELKEEKKKKFMFGGGGILVGVLLALLI